MTSQDEASLCSRCAALVTAFLEQHSAELKSGKHTASKFEV